MPGAGEMSGIGETGWYAAVSSALGCGASVELLAFPGGAEKLSSARKRPELSARSRSEMFDEAIVCGAGDDATESVVTNDALSGVLGSRSASWRNGDSPVRSPRTAANDALESLVSPKRRIITCEARSEAGGAGIERRGRARYTATKR